MLPGCQMTTAERPDGGAGRLAELPVYAYAPMSGAAPVSTCTPSDLL